MIHSIGHRLLGPHSVANEQHGHVLANAIHERLIGFLQSRVAFSSDHSDHQLFENILLCHKLTLCFVS